MSKEKKLRLIKTVQLQEKGKSTGFSFEHGNQLLQIHREQKPTVSDQEPEIQPSEPPSEEELRSMEFKTLERLNKVLDKYL